MGSLRLFSHLCYYSFSPLSRTSLNFDPASLDLACSRADVLARARRSWVQNHAHSRTAASTNQNPTLDRRVSLESREHKVVGITSPADMSIESINLSVADTRNQQPRRSRGSSPTLTAGEMIQGSQASPSGRPPKIASESPQGDESVFDGIPEWMRGTPIAARRTRNTTAPSPSPPPPPDATQSTPPRLSPNRHLSSERSESGRSFAPPDVHTARNEFSPSQSARQSLPSNSNERSNSKEGSA